MWSMLFAFNIMVIGVMVLALIGADEPLSTVPWGWVLPALGVGDLMGLVVGIEWQSKR